MQPVKNPQRIFRVLTGEREGDSLVGSLELLMIKGIFYVFVIEFQPKFLYESL